MFYVDEIDSKVITDKPPVGTIAGNPGTKKISNEGTRQMLKNFWFLMGLTISENYEYTKSLLAKHGYYVTSQKDAAEAIVHLWSTDKWKEFHKDIIPIVQKTTEIKLNTKPVDESSADGSAPGSAPSGDTQGGSSGGFDLTGFGMIAQAAAMGLGAISSVFTGKQDIKRAKIESEAIARQEMLKGLNSVAAQKQAAKQAAAQREANKTSTLIWVLVILFLIIAVTITVIVIKKRNKQA